MPTVRCPGCEAGLKLKAAPPAGKKVRCPKCGAAFAPKLKKAAPRPEEVEILDDGGDEWDDWQADAPPHAPPHAPTGRTRRANPATRSSGGGGGVPKAVWFGLGGLVAAAVLGAVLLTVFDSPDPVSAAGAGPAADVAGAEGGPAGGPGGGPTLTAVAAPFPTEYLPADSDAFLHVRVADLWTNPLVARQIPASAKAAALAAARTQYGLEIVDFESVTVAGPWVRSIAEAFPDGAGGGAAARRRGEQAGEAAARASAGVVRLRADFDLASILDDEGEPILRELATPATGGPVYGGRPGLAVQELAFWSPDARTVVVGTEAVVRAIADATAAPLVRPGFAGLDAAADAGLVFALAPIDGLRSLPTAESVREGGDGEPAPPEAERALDNFDAFRAAGAGLSAVFDLAAGGPVASLLVPLADPADADAKAKAVAAAEDLLAQLRDAAASAVSSNLPPEQAAQLAEIIAAATVDPAGDAVTLRFPLPADADERP